MNAQTKIVPPPPPPAFTLPHRDTPNPEQPRKWFLAEVRGCEEYLSRNLATRITAATSVRLFLQIWETESQTICQSGRTTITMPVDRLASFADKIGYLGSLDCEKLSSDQSPLAGFRFQILAAGIGWDGEDEFFIREETPLLDVRRMDGLELAAHQTQASFDNLVSNASAVFIETIAHSAAHDAGWDFEFARFDQRANFFAGKQTANDGSRAKRTTGLGKRTSMIVKAINIHDRNALQHFVIFQQLPGMHLMLPIWKGDAFWCVPQTDIDVSQIIQNCRGRSTLGNMNPPAPSQS